MLWLDALSRETDIPVTTPLHTKDGKLFVTIGINGVPEPRHCAMFHWINGRIPRKPTLPLIQKVGTVTAKLHNHADTFQKPEPFSTARYDTAFQFGIPEPIYDTNPDPIFTDERRQIVQETARRVESYLATKYQDEAALRFLHADLHMWNIKVNKGEIHVFDFDDSMNIFPVQDIGIALYYYERGTPDDPILREAFHKGYTAVRPWPESFAGEVDIVIAHRTLDLLSLILKDFPNEIDRFLTRNLPRLEKWLARS
jgi:Ser/Thr protein kinase RdoA (MazF antagonist)